MRDAQLMIGKVPIERIESINIPDDALRPLEMQLRLRRVRPSRGWRRNQRRRKAQQRSPLTAILALATLAALLYLPAIAAEPVLKFPKHYAKALGRVEGGPEYFRCDYTTKTCLLGKLIGHIFAGVLLAEDRTTVLAHIACFDWKCTDYDRGIMGYNTNFPQTLTKDLGE